MQAASHWLATWEITELFQVLRRLESWYWGALGYSLPAAYHHFLVDLVCIIVYPLCEDIPK